MDEAFDTSVDTSADMDTSDIVDDVPDDIPADIPEDVPEDVPEMIEEDDLSNDIPEDVPEDESEAPEEDDLSDNIPEDIPEDEPEMIEEDDLSDDVPEDVPEGEPEVIEEDDLSDDIPEDVPEDEPELTENELTEDIPEDVPEDVPDDESEAIEEDDLSDDVPEDGGSEDQVEADDTTTDDTNADVDNADSAEPIEETQDESTDDTATEDAAEDTTSDVDNADSTEPIEETQDEPMDDTATEETASDVDGDNFGEQTDTQNETVADETNEPRDDMATEDTTEENNIEYTNLNNLENKDYYEVAVSSYEMSEKVANESDLKYYKAHDLDGHIRKVVEKSAESADVLESAEGIKLDKNDIGIASLFHDTGMDGGEKYESTDGTGIRKNHPMTSALHALENRAEIEADGANADQVAALSLLHSKSCSGVRDLSDEQQITLAFDKLSTEVATYNKNHPDTQLSFNPENIDVERFKYNAAALRLGDSFGHDSSESKTQSGGHMDITYDTIVPNKTTEWNDDLFMDEIKGSSITYHSPDGITEIIDDEKDASGYTRMYQFGEGNISAMGAMLNDENNYEAYFNVNSDEAPACTLRCINERLDELKTADRLFDHTSTIYLPENCNEETVRLYHSFANEKYSKYGTINIKVGGKNNV